MFKSLVRVIFIVGFIWQGLVANEIGKPFVESGHSSYVNAVAISSDGKYALSGSSVYKTSKDKFKRAQIYHTQTLGSMYQ